MAKMVENIAKMVIRWDFFNYEAGVCSDCGTDSAGGME